MEHLKSSLNFTQKKRKTYTYYYLVHILCRMYKVPGDICCMQSNFIAWYILTSNYFENHLMIWQINMQLNSTDLITWHNCRSHESNIFFAPFLVHTNLLKNSSFDGTVPLSDFCRIGFHSFLLCCVWMLISVELYGDLLVSPN